LGFVLEEEVLVVAEVLLLLLLLLPLLEKTPLLLEEVVVVVVLVILTPGEATSPAITSASISSKSSAAASASRRFPFFLIFGILSGKWGAVVKNRATYRARMKRRKESWRTHEQEQKTNALMGGQRCACGQMVRQYVRWKEGRED
jgi:hypothetical protein